MNIEIETEPFAKNLWYGGSYKIDIGNDEYMEKEYEFTICTGDDDSILEITWVDEIPENVEDVTAQIQKTWNR
jgi:hypothetical protein